MLLIVAAHGGVAILRTPQVYLGVGGKLAFSPDGTRLAYTAADGTFACSRSISAI